MSTYPPISINNTLAEAISVFDAFNDQQADQSLSNYFGTLTAIGSVDAKASASFAPINGPISTYIIYDSHNNPLKRVFTLGSAPQSFEVGQSDVDTMLATQNFVKMLETSPNNPEVQQFNSLLKGGTGNAAAIDAFFKGSSEFQNCSYVSYMLAVVTIARTPASSSAPANEQSYRLSSLLQYMGFDWPPGVPDIVLSSFYCSTDNQRILLGGELNVREVTFGAGVLDNVLSILPSEHLRFTVLIDCEPGLAAGSIQLQCLFDDLSIPIGGGQHIQFHKPTVLLSITPLFKFVVFEIKTTIPFSLFGSPTFNALAALTIDNVEAEIGITLDGNSSTLLTPPGMQGVHFDQFGVGMGLFFEPPGFALGVQGKFHIGSGQQSVQLDDDVFAVVCELEEDVPNPLYIAFYAPKMSLEQVVTIFTNQSCSLDFPVNFSDLSFHWAENPMQPVTLPDGTLAPMGYGFSADLNLFGFGFYGELEINLNDGVQGQLALDPFMLGPVLSLTGDGTGVSIKVDASGNPIRNNTIPRTAAEKQAIAQASSKQLIQPGGAQLQLSTASSPYFTLDASLALLGIQQHIAASIDSGGIHFQLDYGGIISSRMVCVLQDYHNFSGQFRYGPDYRIPLPSIAGYSLGQVHLTAHISTELALNTSATDIVFTAAGGFDFEGLSCQIGPFALDIHIATLSDVLAAIETWLVDNAAKVFAALLGDAAKWAQAVYSNAILPAEQGVAYVVNVLKNSFGQTVNQFGELLKGSSYALDQVANALKASFNATATDVASALNTAYQASADAVSRALQAADYSADQIAGALSSVYQLSAEAAAAILKGLGYGATQVAAALSSAYGATSQAVASALQAVGFAAQDTAEALSAVFGLAPDAINGLLQAAGYAASEVESAFNAIGGAFSDFAKSAWDDVSHYADPTHW